MLNKNMSNLTSSASGTEEATSGVSSSHMYTHNSPASPDQNPPLKKKRNLPGNPDPDAEVIALSPKSLLATNRFICEICSKGFQREQNLQLHKRGHNLPWKLKQRNKEEVIRKKVYVCPETSCVHHDPNRALGDLTGIKKHFFRKHGEKKWKCEKCSKSYAVQSDCKAHSKICGTREYRCDCGTLFSRRDSFITHRAFCDALAVESGGRAAPTITGSGTTNTSTTSSSAAALNFSHYHNNKNNLQTHVMINNIDSSSSGFFLKRELQDQYQQHQEILKTKSLRYADSGNSTPPWLTCSSTVGGGPSLGSGPHIDMSNSLFPASSDQLLFLSHENPSPSPSNNPILPPFQSTLLVPSPSSSSASSHMYSATSLLQKAAQIGVSMSHHHHHHPSLIIPHHQAQHHIFPSLPTSCNNTLSSLPFLAKSDEEKGSGFVPDQSSSSSSFIPHHHDHRDDYMMMSTTSLPCATSDHGGFEGSALHHEESFDGILLSPRMSSVYYKESFTKSAAETVGSGGGSGGNDGLTRDFLGLRAFSQRDFLDMAGLHHHHPNNSSSSSSSSYKQQNRNGTLPWQ